MISKFLKRTFSLVLTFALILSLFCGCGSKRIDAQHKPLSTFQNASAVSAAIEDDEVIVYVTETGTKYHRSGCPCLAQSCIPMDLTSAKRSYGPCSKCNPPE